ncbi:MAG: hypothetical protein JRI68_01555 [Deltaproteobacteria bacterium]|nr:hypothetical protein [Deltaproteobacteria bacterium]
MSKQTDMARYAPYAFGAAALVIGLLLAVMPELRGGAGESGSAPVDGGLAETAIDGAPGGEGGVVEARPDPPERYVPDLSGEDVGKLIIESPGSAHDLVVAAGHLVWLITEAATVRAAPLAGGAARPIYASTSDDAFGGGLVASETKLYWSVEQADGSAETIVVLAQKDVSTDKPSPRPVITEGSPDHLQATGDDLVWSDHGVILRLGAGESSAQGIVDRKQLIAGLALVGTRLAWLEVPYEHATKGGHGVMTLSLEDEESPRTVAAPKADHHRELLLATGEQLVWVEGKQDGPWALVRVAKRGDSPERLAPTGAVTALVTDGASLYWAELHGEGDTAVSLLRSVSLGGGEAKRLGRDSGPVPALAVHDGALYWATGKGIKRLALVP